jgi:hypothetical protein
MLSFPVTRNVFRSFLFCVLAFQSLQAGNSALVTGTFLTPAQTDSLLDVLKARVDKYN